MFYIVGIMLLYLLVNQKFVKINHFILTVKLTHLGMKKKTMVSLKQYFTGGLKN